MLTRVEVRTQQGNLLLLPLGDASNGVIIAEIGGLDPVNATIVSTSFANMDGEQYHSSRRESRNITMKLQLDTGNTSGNVRDIRRRLYNYLMPKSQVGLRFVDSDGLNVDISGRVESFEAPLFTNEPVVDVSIMCFNPDFYDATSVVFSGKTTSDTSTFDVEYKGTVETGVQFSLNVDRAISEFSIYHRTPEGELKTLEFNDVLTAGDILRINTIAGNKSVYLTRAGTTRSVLYGMTPQSNWIEIEPGLNRIQIYAEGAGIPYNLEYTTKYGGL